MAAARGKSDALPFVYLLGDESFDQPVARGKKGRLRNASGLNLYTRRWEVEDPKALVVLVHGYLHRMDPFHDHVAGQLNRMGITVAGFDLPGHGRSEGVKALVPRLASVAQDVIQLTRKQPEASRRIPVFLMADCMGAAVALFAVEREPLLFAGMVMIAPLLGLPPSKRPDAFVQQALMVWASVDPTAPVLPGAENVADGYKDVGYLMHGVMRDPYGYAGGMRLGTALALVEAATKFDGGFGFVNLPFLGCMDAVAQGTKDHVTDPRKSRDLYDTAPSRDKTFLEFKDAAHALWWEPQDTRRKLLDDIMRWFQDHIDAPGNAIDQVRHLRRPVGTEGFIPGR